MARMIKVVLINKGGSKGMYAVYNGTQFLVACRRLDDAKAIAAILRSEVLK